MRALVSLTIVMGVLIVIGTATVAVTIVRRMGAAAPRPLADTLVEEPAGTRIAGVAGLGDRLALLLQGGGSDRVLLLDPATGRSLGYVKLVQPK